METQLGAPNDFFIFPSNPCDGSSKTGRISDKEFNRAELDSKQVTPGECLWVGMKDAVTHWMKQASDETQGTVEVYDNDRTTMLRVQNMLALKFHIKCRNVFSYNCFISVQ